MMRKTMLAVAVSLDTLERRTIVTVVPDDKRPARWSRQVDRIEVRQLQ